MLKSQEIQLAQEKLRQDIANLQKTENRSEDANTQLDKLLDDFQNGQRELRASLVIEDAERDQITEPDKAKKDFDAECRAFNVAAVVEALESGKTIEGREAEVTKELETRDGPAKQGIRFPWEALDTRANATVTAPDASSGDLATRPTMRALERLFDQSAAHSFGFRAMSVTGQPRFPELTGGAAASWVAEGNGADAAAITTDVTTPEIHTLTARYLISRQATRQNSALEPMLRRDLSEVLREALDLAVFQGTDSDNQPAGLSSVLTAASSQSGNPVTYTDIVNWATEIMASAKLVNMSGVSVAGVPFHLASLLTATFGDILTQYEQAKKIVPNLTFANNVSAITEGSPDSASMYIAAPAQHAHVINWGSPELVYDPFSESKSGKIALTVFAFTDILAQRQSTHWMRVDGIGKGSV